MPPCPLFVPAALVVVVVKREHLLLVSMLNLNIVLYIGFLKGAGFRATAGELTACIDDKNVLLMIDTDV